MSAAVDSLELLRDKYLAAIDRSPRGKWSIKVKTLMADFGFSAGQRVRQTSFLAVLDMLDKWEIEYHCSGNSSNDYISLNRKASVRAAQPTSSAPPTPSTTDNITWMESFSPLSFLFEVGETLDEFQSQANAVDAQNAVWSFHPVCLFVDATDEFFSFACGYFSALMRRRALTVRRAQWLDFLPLAPQIVSTSELKRYFGQSVDFAPRDLFPLSGAVYILRDDPNDVEDDEVIALTREYFVPHTYRLRAKFAPSSSDTPQGNRVTNASDYSHLVGWTCALSGSFQLSRAPMSQQVDVASLLAEAAQTFAALLERQALRSTDTAFRAGFESTEHMALKSALLNGLRRTHPNDSIAVEELISSNTVGYEPDQDADGTSRNDKPDLRIGNKVWVEIETLRGLSLRGSNPFFALEAKLRQKLNTMRACQEIWLIVPNDVALLGSTQLLAVTRNLNAALGSGRLRCGFMDIVAESPVFLEETQPKPRDEVKLTGASWRIKRQVIAQPVVWSDVAGYSDVKDRLQQEILDPLKDPEKYAPYGLVAANGLLLYGLPGCGKSLIGRVLAGEAELTCRFIMPSDMTSMWLGEGVMKVRALFDWALRQAPCLLVLDELDAVAPQRREGNMHTDEKRQVNELLAQLDRIAGKGVVVVATTNYVRGIDTAIQRSGRFDLKLPIFPPDVSDREEIFNYYLSPPRLQQIRLSGIDLRSLATEAVLFTPADIKTVVQKAARRAVQAHPDKPSLSTDHIRQAMLLHSRSIRQDMAEEWVEEASTELGIRDQRLLWLREEMRRALVQRS
ncbi:MAG: ATP-binding protein [Anaerolineae bacterium]